jgi:hypothetical protein
MCRNMDMWNIVEKAFDYNKIDISTGGKKNDI